MVSDQLKPHRTRTNRQAGITKKTSLRNKSSKKLSNKISEFKETTDAEYHENPFLKLLKISKKEKQHNKSVNFTNSLADKVTFNTSNGVSKSALRRRKRKEKDVLKPKMDELLTSLPDFQTTIQTKIQTPQPKEFVKSTKTNLNKPNAHKTTGHNIILKQENKNFSNVLKNPEFKQSPFSALKAAIQQNLNQ